MPTVLIVVIAVLSLLVAAIVFYILVRRLSRKEIYGSFLRLKTRQKIMFFRRLLKDHRMPWYFKLIPLATVAYLAIPFDIIPDFIPIVGYLDDVAVVLISLVLIIKLTPKGAVKELLAEAHQS